MSRAGGSMSQLGLGQSRPQRHGARMAGPHGAVAAVTPARDGADYPPEDRINGARPART